MADEIINVNECNNLSDKTISGMIWKFGERITAQLVSTIVSIVLARILMPKDYGVVALVTIFITICNVFVSSGFGSALIQKKNADNIDFSSVLYVSIIIGAVLYFILFFTAPFIAEFYGNDIICPVLRFMGLRLPIASVNSVQQAYVARKMEFKKFFLATIIGTVVSGIVGIYMALNGYGVWALVAQYLINVFIDTVILGIVIKWKPDPVFSFKRIKTLFGFGSKMLASALIDTGYNQLQGLIIGKKFSGEDLAYYEKGQRFPSLIATNINASLNGVLLSTMSKLQDDIVKVKVATRKSIKLCSFLLIPCMVGLAAIGENFIHVLLTDKWMFMLPFLYIFCVSYAFWPLHTANLTAIQAIGRSDLFLILEICKKSIGIILIVVTTIFGNPFWIAMTAVFTTITSFFINAFPNRKLLHYGYLEQIKDLLPSASMSLLVGIPVYCMNYINFHRAIILVVQVVVGIGLYILFAKLFKSKDYKYLIDKIKLYKKKNKS